jgi:aminomethyltransferase
MASSLAHTPLYDWHAAHGGRLVDFAGWEMPVQYGSIVAEHQATRTSAGVFDISHMGRLSLKGVGAEAFLDRIVSRRATDMRPGQIRYALVTNDAGGILDDVLVYRLETATGELPAWMLVVNASNRGKIVDWLDAQRPPAGCEIHDGTGETAMIAVQGPRAIDLLAPLLGDAHKSLKYYYASEMPLAGRPSSSVLVSRTGYTGEDGWEIVVDAALAGETWERIVEAGRSLGATAAGLGARDTLRLEAAMPLYGHELTDKIDPYQAGLAFAVDLESRSFPGQKALVELRVRKDRPVRVGWEMTGRRVPREGYSVIAGGKTVGHVTSGTFSPTLEKPIAMGYIRADLAEPGTEVAIDLRGRQEPARVVALPFYRRPSPGRKT